MQTLEISESLEVSSNPELLHGCHMECQLGAPYPIMACGIIAEWSEGLQGTDYPECDKCWVEGVQCPVCGTPLRGE